MPSLFTIIAYCISERLPLFTDKSIYCLGLLETGRLALYLKTLLSVR